MSFKRLSNIELQALEKEFVQFLAANTITQKDWDKIKKSDAEKTEHLINLFSNIVWEKTLGNIKYLEFVSEKDYKVFYCGRDKIYVRALSIKKGDATLNTHTIKQLIDLNAQAEIQVQHLNSDKAYSPSRSEELYRMIEQGCTIGTEDSFKSLDFN
ncbi:MAG: cag pathogenicity island protein 24 [Flavobacteriales bacterium]|jgi:cag pathogenicity island protein 24